MENLNLEEIEDKIEMAISHDDEKSMGNVRFQIKKLIDFEEGPYKKEISESKSLGTLYYLLGYSFYNSPEDSLSRLKTSIDYFRKALKFYPKHIMSTLYLGHCYFDVKRYEDALESFEFVLEHGKVGFEQADQKWRVAKLYELQSICYFYCNNFKNFSVSSLVMFDYYQMILFEDKIVFQEYKDIFLELIKRENIEFLHKNKNLVYKFITLSNEIEENKTLIEILLSLLGKYGA